MNDIRVTYSGLISLVLGVINIPLGFAFMLIVTRTLTITEYGTWGLITGIIVYATILEPMISYWTIREVARNQHSGKTSIFSGFLFSLIGIVVYLISAYIVGSKTDADQNIILFAGILIPLIFINRIFHGITLGWKPQGLSYGQLIFGITQIPVAMVFIYFLKLGTIGVIYTVAIGYGVSIFFFLIYNKEKIRGSIEKKFIRKWLKLSWIPVYPALGGMIFFLDIAIFSLITESVVGIAFWTASMVIATAMSNSTLISRAVYSKLLQGNTTHFVGDNLRHLFYVSILFLGIIVTFAKPGLFVFNPEYIIAEFIVIILAVQLFIGTISSYLQTNLMGIENVDTNKKSTFRDYVKSKLFLMPSLILIQSIIYVILLTVMLLTLVSIVDSQIDLILYWAIIGLIVQIPLSIYIGIIFKKNFSINLDVKDIGKYFISAIVSFGITHVLINSFLEYNVAIIEFLPSVFLFIIFSVVMYIGITIVIDSNTRILVKSIISEIKK